MRKLWVTLGAVALEGIVLGMIALGVIFLTGCGGSPTDQIQDIKPTAMVGSETDARAQGGGEHAQDGEDYVQNVGEHAQSVGDHAQSGERITLMLGAVNVNWRLESAVDAYNAQSEKYYVEIVDYLPEKHDSAIYEASCDRFKMDLATGKGMDIVAVGTLTVDELGYAGVLMDLNAFLTDEAKQEKYLGNILECVQTGEALCEQTPTGTPYNYFCMAELLLIFCILRHRQEGDSAELAPAQFY